MNYFLNRSTELFEETVKNRRYIHQNAECGLELPNTVKYVVEQLTSYGYDNIKIVGGGVTCTAGQGDKTLLLRGDMDALVQDEVSGVPFACTTGACHSCGHDMHTAMLLTAAKMLKEKEAELKNVIKFMFQPGEEVLAGAKAMIADGILENPHVDCAMGMHSSGNRTGQICYGHGKTRGAAAFKISVHGCGSHGAAPASGVNAGAVAANILTAAQQILAYEVRPGEDDILTFGVIQAGTVENVLPGEAVLRGTIRSHSNENIDYLKNRLSELSGHIAKAFRATAEVEYNPEIYALIVDHDMMEEFKDYLKEVTDDVEERIGNSGGTEDFAAISVKVPTIFINIGVGSPEEGYTYAGHNPHNVRNEEGMKVGAAAYAHCAYRWANKA